MGQGQSNGKSSFLSRYPDLNPKRWFLAPLEEQVWLAHKVNEIPLPKLGTVPWDSPSPFMLHEYDCWPLAGEEMGLILTQSKGASEFVCQLAADRTRSPDLYWKLKSVSGLSLIHAQGVLGCLRALTYIAKLKPSQLLPTIPEEKEGEKEDEGEKEGKGSEAEVRGAWV